MSGLKLIVGLGNPGAEHLMDRHNAGFWFVDALAQRLGAHFTVQSRLHCQVAKASMGDEEVWLLKPNTYMNRSGLPVAAALRYYRIEPRNMLVCHDELDLPPGSARLKFDGGHGGQNGLRDIISHVGHGAFHRLRIGIGHPGHRDRVTAWVLGRPGRADEDAILDSVAAAEGVLPLAVQGDFERAMHQLHSRRDSA